MQTARSKEIAFKFEKALVSFLNPVHIMQLKPIDYVNRKAEELETIGINYSFFTKKWRVQLDNEWWFVEREDPFYQRHYESYERDEKRRDFQRKAYIVLEVLYLFNKNTYGDSLKKELLSGDSIVISSRFPNHFVIKKMTSIIRKNRKKTKLLIDEINTRWNGEFYNEFKPFSWKNELERKLKSSHSELFDLDPIFKEIGLLPSIDCCFSEVEKIKTSFDSRPIINSITECHAINKKAIETTLQKGIAILDKIKGQSNDFLFEEMTSVMRECVQLSLHAIGDYNRTTTYSTYSTEIKRSNEVVYYYVSRIIGENYHKEFSDKLGILHLPVDTL